MLKNLLRVPVFFFSFIVISTSFLCAQQNPAPVVHRADGFALSPPLRELARSAGAESPVLTSGSGFSAGLSVLGLGNGFPNFTVSANAPDSNLAVGSSQIVQWANIAFAIFDKSTGAVEAGPLSTGSVWQSLGGACANGSNAASELIVQWDRAHQRWMLSQSTMTSPPYETCIAISTSSDATGSYYLYAFSQGSLLPESPKWGVWSNGYYQTQGEFSGSGFVGPELCAYNSAKLLVGDGSAEQICFTLSPADGLPLPADIDSSLAPPAGEDEFFLSLWDPSHLSLYSLHPDYPNPQNSSVTGTNGSQLIAVPVFTPACNGAYGGNCVPQKRHLRPASGAGRSPDVPRGLLGGHAAGKCARHSTAPVAFAALVRGARLHFVRRQRGSALVRVHCPCPRSSRDRPFPVSVGDLRARLQLSLDGFDSPRQDL